MTAPIASPWRAIAHFERVAAGRRLTPAEVAAIGDAYYAEGQLQPTLPGRIMLLRAELRTLERRLWPSFVPQLRALEAEDEARRLARLEAELNTNEEHPRG